MEANVKKLQISLKAARVNKGYNILDAAPLLGMGKDTLIKYEKNPGLVPPVLQTKFSVVYGIPIDNIFFG